MLAPLHCLACHTFLVTTNLAKFHKVTVTCQTCGHVNIFTYDAARYVKKRSPKGRGLFEEAHGAA